MKGKQLALLLLLVVLIGGAGYLMQQGNRSSWSETSVASTGKILNFPLNDVTKVVVKNATGDTKLAKKNDEWVVEDRADYPANFTQVGEMLRKLWDLKPVQDVKVGPSQLGRMELIEPGKGDGSGTLLDLKDKDGKTVASLLLGKKFLRKSEGMPGDFPGTPAGRYVMATSGPAKVSLVSESFEDVDTKPEKWLKRDFFKVENIKSVELSGQTEPMHWKLTRADSTAEWKLNDLKPDDKVDTGKVSSVTAAFSNPAFNDVLAPDAKPDETGLDKPSVITIETFDSFTYTIKVGKANGDNYPVLVAVTANIVKERPPGKDEKPEDKTKLDQEFQDKVKKLEEKLDGEKKFGQRPYLMTKFSIDNVLKERSGLIAEKKPETPATSSTTPTPSGAPLAPGAVQAVTPPIEAVTPPVAVPALTEPNAATPPKAAHPSDSPKPAAATPAPAPSKPTTAVTEPVSITPATPAPAAKDPDKKAPEAK